MIDQLERMGIVGDHYLDLINDYMALWDIKNKLIKDIKKRGVTVEYQNGKDQKGTKKNESISELNKTSAQMLKLLSDLGLKPIKQDEDDDDDEM